MVTVAHLVKGMIKDKPFLQEALAKKIISYGNLAEQFLPKIEEELGKKVKHSAVVMALRRYADELENVKAKVKFSYDFEIILKTNLCAIDMQKSKKTAEIMKKLYSLVDYEKGDTLKTISSTYEHSIITNDKYREDVLDILKGEKIITKQSNLVSLTMKMPDNFYDTPGVIFSVVRQLAWENINIYEIISTYSELTVILKEKDSSKAYNCLQELISRK